MASELERRATQGSTLQGRLQATRDQSKILRGGGSRNVNSAASRISGGKTAAPVKRRPQGFTSPSAEWNSSGGPSVLGKPRNPPEEPIAQFLFSGAPSLEQFMAMAQQNSGAEGYQARIADAERRKQEALQAISFGSEDLARGIEASRGTVNAGYDTALNQTKEGLAAAQAAMENQKRQTAERQQQEWASLGLDARPNDAAESDSAFANTLLTSQNNAAQSQLQTNQASQNSLNTAYVNAARGRGLEDQNASRRNYDSSIAELLDMQAQAKAQAAQQASSQYQQARGNWANDRDFAYNEWVRNQENDRGDARWLLEQQMSQRPDEVELTPFQRYMQAQGQAGVTSGTAQRWLDQASVGVRNKDADLSEWIGGGSTQARSNILEYLKAMGML